MVCFKILKIVLQKKNENHTDDEAPSWKEILENETKNLEISRRKEKSRKPKLKKEAEVDDGNSVTSSISIPEVDVDLTPSKEWTLADKIRQTKAVVHKEINSETDDRNLVKKSINKPKLVKKEKIVIENDKNKQLLSPNIYDKSKIVKGSPSRKSKKPKKEKKEKVLIEKKPAEPQGKLIRKIPRPPKRNVENLNANDQIQGQNILVQDPDQDLQSRKESSINSDDDNTSNLDVTLSDNGIQGNLDIDESVNTIIYSFS